MPFKAWNKLGEFLHETRLIGSIQNTLYWDQNTAMPFGGASWRGEQLSLLARILHSRQTSSQLEELISEAKDEMDKNQLSGDLSPFQLEEYKRNLQLLNQDQLRQKSLDPVLVSHIAKAQSEGYMLWQKARSSNDFNIFKPSLKLLISLRQQQAKQINEESSCWETLAQPFEPDLTKVRLDELFLPLRKLLPDLLEKVRSIKRPSLPNWDLAVSDQRKLCNLLLDELGRDENITCLANSPHPFSITLGPKDFRITSRIVPGQPLSCFLATAHEWGHSLYEQGLPEETHQWFAWPLGQATSMAIHESQSLFWENRVARSFAFSERFWNRFSDLGAPLDSSFDLWLAMNKFQPGLNRVEADELTYGLHILIRTDLEIDLLERGMEVDALPSEWNDRYQKLLGLSPGSDREGCLQDVHWSEGQFGYFPSYLLGHLISAQISEAMNSSFSGVNEDKAEDSIDNLVSEGDYKRILSWLRKEIHPHGRRVNAEDLVRNVTGESLSSSPFLKYLEKKIELLSSSS